jgi:hypothetical protein
MKQRRRLEVLAVLFRKDSLASYVDDAGKQLHHGPLSEPNRDIERTTHPQTAIDLYERLSVFDFIIYRG